MFVVSKKSQVSVKVQVHRQAYGIRTLWNIKLLKSICNQPHAGRQLASISELPFRTALHAWTVCAHAAPFEISSSSLIAFSSAEVSFNVLNIFILLDPNDLRGTLGKLRTLKY